MKLNCIKKNKSTEHFIFKYFLSKLGVKDAEIKLTFVLLIKGLPAQCRANQNKNISVYFLAEGKVNLVGIIVKGAAGHERFKIELCVKEQ